VSQMSFKFQWSATTFFFFCNCHSDMRLVLKDIFYGVSGRRISWLHFTRTRAIITIFF
jgi:hypothetical protein